jgi:hypothetical protein
VREATGDSLQVAFVDQGYCAELAAADAEKHDVRLEAVKRPAAKRGFVLLPAMKSWRPPWSCASPPLYLRSHDLRSR